jgi:hypothetical protein
LLVKNSRVISRGVWVFNGISNSYLLVIHSLILWCLTEALTTVLRTPGGETLADRWTKACVKPERPVSGGVPASGPSAPTFRGSSISRYGRDRQGQQTAACLRLHVLEQLYSPAPNKWTSPVHFGGMFSIYKCSSTYGSRPKFCSRSFPDWVAMQFCQSAHC